MKETKKLVNLDYSEVITLGLIESDDVLSEIFKEEIKLPFNILIRLSKEGKLNDAAKELLLNIFETIILTKEVLIEKYIKIAESDGIKLSITKLNDNEGDIKPFVKPVNTILEVISESKTELSKPIFKGKIEGVKTPKKEKKLPRRFGKLMILKEIEKQGGKATPVQNAMLKVNQLKNSYVTLSNRGISDMVGGTNFLTDADCRDIVAAITIVERKLVEILKRKNSLN